MPSIEVDLVLFVVETIVVIIGIPFMVGWGIWQAYRNPEWWLRLRKQDWVYVGVRTLLGRIRPIAVNTKKIEQDGTVRLFGGRRTYYIKDTDKSGLPTLVAWKHNKPFYQFFWDDPNPVAWHRNPGLTTDTDPETITEKVNSKVILRLARYETFLQWVWATLGISIVSLVVGIAIIFFVSTLNGSITTLNHLLTPAPTNSTGPPANPGGR